MPFENSPVAHEILYGPTKTALIGEAGGSIVYNRALIDFARHNGLQPKTCRPKGAVENRTGQALGFTRACTPCAAAGAHSVVFAQRKPIHSLRVAGLATQR